MFAENSLKIALIISGLFAVYEGATIRAYKNSTTDYIETLLSNPLAILNTTYFDKNRPTVMYTHGFNASADGNYSKIAIKALIDRNTTNVCVLNWATEARSGPNIALSFITTGEPNARRIGIEEGRALVKLANAGVDMSTMTLIGHSLGAIVHATACETTQISNIMVGRILVLDAVKEYLKLASNAAKSQIALHTNPAKYGSNQSIGIIDVWANCDDNGMQPGCPIGDFETFSPDDLCSHVRAILYMAEWVTSPASFVAAAATSCTDWVNQDGDTDQTINLAEVTTSVTSARGNFYFSTNSQSPFGKKTAGLVANSS